MKQKFYPMTPDQIDSLASLSKDQSPERRTSNKSYISNIIRNYSQHFKIKYVSKKAAEICQQHGIPSIFVYTISSKKWPSLSSKLKAIRNLTICDHVIPLDMSVRKIMSFKGDKQKIKEYLDDVTNFEVALITVAEDKALTAAKYHCKRLDWKLAYQTVGIILINKNLNIQKSKMKLGVVP